MFLAAVARPRLDFTKNCHFDGKLGIWPFVIWEKAKRNCRKRPAGSMVTNPIESINKDQNRNFLIEKLLVSIKEKWPRHEKGVIKIKQDNARPHIKPNDKMFNIEVERLGLNVDIVFQPPNSPDLNALDLGYFNSIQSTQYKEAPNNIDELIDAVVKSFNSLKNQNYNKFKLKGFPAH